MGRDVSKFLSSGFCAILVLAIVVTARAEASGNATNDLGGTSWQLVKFEGGNDEILKPDDRTKYTIAFGTDGNVTARNDCNHGQGRWTSSGPTQLEIGPLAISQVYCPGNPISDRFARDLGFVRSYIMRDGHLFLALKMDSGIYELEPAPGPPIAAGGPVTYRCTQSPNRTIMLRATYYKTIPALAVLESNNQTRVAFLVPAAGGTRYQGQGVALSDAHRHVLVTWQRAELKCAAVSG